MQNLPVPDQHFSALKQAAYQLSTCTDQIFQQIEQAEVLNGIIDRIRSSLDLEEIFNTTAIEIRQLLNVDRVGVLRFFPDNEVNKSKFVAEDVAAGFPSALAAQAYDSCFISQFAAHHTQSTVQAVADIYTAEFSDCHIKLLEQFQVRAKLIVPVLKGMELWGFLCVHQCSGPRRWQLSEIEFVRKIANHFAIALQQAEQLEQITNQTALLAETKAQTKALLYQKTLVKITNRIRQSFDFAAICQIACDEVRQLLTADRVSIYRFNSDWSGNFLFESVAEDWKPLVSVSPTIEDTHLMETQGGRYAKNETFAVPDIYEAGHSDCHIALLEEFQARAYAIAPIFDGERLWGLLTTFQNAAPRQWQADEIELLAQIGEQLGIALQQADFVRQIQAQATELKETLEELQQSQIQLIQNEKMASLGQLVAGVAHEINNPVNFIHGNIGHVKGYAQDLLTLVRLYQQLDPTSETDLKALRQHIEALDIDFILEDFPKTIASMEVGTDRIKQIVLSLRNFSRLDEALVKVVDLHEGIDSTLLILGHRLKTCSDITIEVIKNYGELPQIESYPAQLNQVFMNLVANSLDAIEEAISCGKLGNSDQPSPTLWITTQPYDSDQVEIRIRDNGIGLAPDTATKIFDHFFTTKPVSKGTGLGLAISRQIVVEKHRGSLVCTPNPDQGVEFTMRLPCKLPIDS